MDQVKLSLTPRQESRWETHAPSGGEFLIAPLLPADERAFTRESTARDGEVDPIAFAHKVAQKCIKDWRYLGNDAGALPCNAENVKTFVDHHALSIMPWLIWRARDISHYVAGEVEAAKKD